MRARFPATIGAVMLLAAVAGAQQWGPWRALGPFDHPGGISNLTLRHQPEKELARMYHDCVGPDLQATYRGEDGMPLHWQVVAGGSTAFDVGPIVFAEELPPVPDKPGWTDESAAFLHRSAEMASDRDVYVHLGSDDGVKVWLNGELLLDHAVGRGVNLYDESLVLPMRAGTNHLLVEVVNGQGGWGFRMGPWRTANQLEIDQAIQRAIQHFVNQQLVDGSWGYLRHIEPGPTAFTLYTLQKCDLRHDHPTVRRARAFVLANDNDATYPLSTKILALAEMNEDGDRERVGKLLEQLWENQLDDGLFLYSIDGYNSHLARGDMSNTLFAGLAMRAASQVGVAISSARWTKLARGVLSCWQPSDGVPRTGGRAEPRGFSYTPNSGATSSMTVAGVSLLAIVEEQAGERIGGSVGNQTKLGILTGLSWLDEHFAWNTNVGQWGGHHNYFSIYGVERVGGLLDLPVIANQDWYFEGSRFLLGKQSPEGTWSEAGGHVETELALLFLERATARSSGPRKGKDLRVWDTTDDPDAAVALRGIGDTPATIWVESVNGELLAGLEWSGQQGRGPHVSQVDYFARRGVPGAPVERIGQVLADPREPRDHERYALQHGFPANGTWFVHARVTCVKEERAQGIAPEKVELLSAEMEIQVRDFLSDEQLTYAEKALENLLLGVSVHAKASSQIQGEEAERAVDGRPETRWHCATNDASPKLTLAFDPPVRGREVVLSHGWPRPAYRESPRPLKGKLVVNGRSTFEWSMDPDPMVKTAIDLGNSFRIRTLELTIEETLYGELGRSAFGFSEVEVYGRR